MAEYEVTHTTRYSYSERVSHCHNIGYLTPQSDARQVCQDTQIIVNPYPTSLFQHSDYFGNRFYYFSIEAPHEALEVVGKTRVTTHSIVENNFSASPSWELVRNDLVRPEKEFDILAAEYTLASPFVKILPDLADYARQSFTKHRPILEAAFDLTQRIHRDFKYDVKSTTILTPLLQVFQKRKGVCQDFAHLAISALRSLGLAARYVSGYIETLPAPGKEKLRGSDASHAWFAVYVPGEFGGWYDFDPTNGKAITEQFIVTARGRDFGDVSPLKGILFGGGKNVLKVEVDVHRVS